MKRSIFEQVVTMVNGGVVEDMENLRTEINAEWERTNAKAVANRNTYEAAREVAFTILNETPKTVKEIFAEGEGQWPEGFTAAKVQYALLHYWNDVVTKHDNGKNASTYSV